MTTKQENKRSMYLVTREYLTKHSGITATLPNYAQYFADAESGISEIERLSEDQQLDKKGFTVLKKQLKRRLIGFAVELSRKGIAYAKHVNNQPLLNEINYSESELRKSADTLLKDKCQIIYDQTHAYAAELVSYEVTPALFSDLENALAAYQAAIPSPRMGIAERKLATKHLDEAFIKTDAAINEIDVLMEIIRNTQSEFYEGYKAVRMIVDSGTRKFALSGKVKDSVTGDALRGAKVIFKMKTEAEEIEIKKRTANAGGFIIKHLDEGDYQVSVSKPGYEIGHFTVHVTEGIFNRFEAELVPMAG